MKIMFLGAQTGVGNLPGAEACVAFGVNSNFIGTALQGFADDSGELRFSGTGRTVDENVDTGFLLGDGGFEVGQNRIFNLLQVREVVQRERCVGRFLKERRLQIVFTSGRREKRR